jgi:hypothetical protein
MTHVHLNLPATRPAQPKLAEIARVPIAGHAQLWAKRVYVLCVYSHATSAWESANCPQHDGACNLCEGPQISPNPGDSGFGMTPLE